MMMSPSTRMFLRCTLIVALLLAPVVGSAQQRSLPDPQKTPGDVLKSVPTSRMAECLARGTGSAVSVGDPITRDLICTSGYAKCVRRVSATVRREVFKSYGLEGDYTGYCSEQGCEIDHLIPLELGGSNDQKNLWPQPYGGCWNAHVKNRLGTRYYREVCAGRIPLDQAQDEILTDWIKSYQKHLGNLACSST